MVKNQVVNVLPKPKAKIASTDLSKIFYLGDNGVMVCFNDQTDGASQWSWVFNSTDLSPAQNPCFQVDKVGLYCVNLVVKNNSGCADKDSLCVEVKQKEITFPNIYTPNSDGTNDLFTINSSGYEKISCEIYSRWGNRLYSWEGLSGGWNGQLEDGRQASDGTYFFTAIFTDKNGKTLKKIGSFMLMR
jgi:gliding motility-associated-like protein